MEGFRLFRKDSGQVEVRLHALECMELCTGAGDKAFESFWVKD